MSTKCPNPKIVHTRLVAAYKAGTKSNFHEYLGIDDGKTAPSYDKWMHWLSEGLGGSKTKLRALLNQIVTDLGVKPSPKHIKLLVKANMKIYDDIMEMDDAKKIKYVVAVEEEVKKQLAKRTTRQLSIT